MAAGFCSFKECPVSGSSRPGQDTGLRYSPGRLDAGLGREQAPPFFASARKVRDPAGDSGAIERARRT
jgi:hypothetical protein